MALCQVLLKSALDERATSRRFHSHPWNPRSRPRRDDREYRLYSTEEQRRPRGCIARRMSPDFHHGLLVLYERAPPYTHLA